MAVQSKSIYEEEAPGDGVRVLTTNYWPRGVSRARAGVYKRVLGPSRPLLRAFKDGEIDWPAYEARYLEEMAAEPARLEIEELAQLALTDTVTVMCMCKDEDQCHRRLLRDLIAAATSIPA